MLIDFKDCMAFSLAFTVCVFVCFYRLDSDNYVSERDIQFRLMDVLQESRFSGADHSPCPVDASENGRSSHIFTQLFACYYYVKYVVLIIIIYTLFKKCLYITIYLHLKVVVLFYF